MPRTDLVSLIIRLAIGLVILVVIGWLLFVRLRKPRVVVTPTPNPSDTPVVIVTESPAPSILPSPSLPEIGSTGASQPSGTTPAQSHGSGYYMVTQPQRDTIVAQTSDGTTTRTTYRKSSGTMYIVTTTQEPTTITSTNTSGQTITVTAGSATAQSQASASGSSATATASVGNGSASASAYASSN
jgi:hypothetical protein